jgi:replicative DNA helicase
MEKIFDTLYEKIITNKQNKEEGKMNSILFPFPRFSELFPGWEKGKYYIASANSGVGKTKLAKFLSITTVYQFIKLNPHLKYKIFYFALEETKEDFWLGVISTILYEKYNIDISPSQLKSLGNFTLEQSVVEKLQECKDIVNDMETYIEVIDFVSNPTGIFKTVKRYFDDPLIGKEIQDEHNSEAKGYEYTDPNLWVFVITDHISLLSQESIEGYRLSLHETISLFSKQYCLKKFCKKYHCITINIQQQESGKEKQEFYRGETIEEKLEPSLDGLGENKTTQRDADVVFGLFAPARYNIQYYRGYDIVKLGDKYRALKILKDRHHGCANRYVHLKFNGATNYFSELPKPTEIDYNQI